MDAVTCAGEAMSRVNEALMALADWLDLRDSPRVTATFKGRREPDTHDVQRDSFVQRALAKREHISVVVQPGPFGGLLAPTERASDPANFVGHHRFAIARSTEHDPSFTVPTRHRFGCRANEERIIYRLITLRPEVPEFVAGLSQESFDPLFVSKAGVI